MASNESNKSNKFRVSFAGNCGEKTIERTLKGVEKNMNVKIHSIPEKENKIRSIPEKENKKRQVWANIKDLVNSNSKFVDIVNFCLINPEYQDCVRVIFGDIDEFLSNNKYIQQKKMIACVELYEVKRLNLNVRPDVDTTEYGFKRI